MRGAARWLAAATFRTLAAVTLLAPLAAAHPVPARTVATLRAVVVSHNHHEQLVAVRPPKRDAEPHRRTAQAATLAEAGVPVGAAGTHPVGVAAGSAPYPPSLPGNRDPPGTERPYRPAR